MQATLFCLGVNAIRDCCFSTLERIYFNLSRQTTKQLKLHSLGSPRTPKYLAHHIRARREVMLEDRLASTLHVS